MLFKIKNFFLSFTVVFFIAAVTSFTAYNWKLMSNFQKLGVPSLLIILGALLYLFFKEEKYKNLVLFLTSFLIGTLFAVFGQVYQTGADSWILFRNWAFFLVIPMILSASYSIFSLFIVVLFLCGYFYFSLFLSDSQALYISLSIPLLVILYYPVLSKQLKFNFYNIFYDIFVSVFYILFNIAGSVIIIFDNSPIFKGYNNLDPYLKFSYPMIIGILFLLCFKYFKRTVILPFSIMSTGIFIWSFFTNLYFSNPYNYDITTYFLVTLIIFIITLTILLKNIPEFKIGFLSKVFSYIGIFFKLFILMSGMGLFISIFVLTNSSIIGFLIIGICLISLSIYLPKFLKFKEDKQEVLSFFLGLFLINMFIISKFDYMLNIKDILLIAGVVDIILFNIFWYLKPTKTLDFLFLPAQFSFILILLVRIFSEENSLIYTTILSILGICIIPLQLIYKNKIENSKYKYRIKRIFYGHSFALFSFFISIQPTFVFSNFETTGKFYYYLIIFKDLIIILLSIFIVNFELKNQKKSLKNIIIFSTLIAFIQFFASYINIANYIILLILLYTSKNYKWTTNLLNIALCFRVFYYYFNLYHITLLQKSIYMFILSLALLVSYLIVKYFIKEEAVNE